MNERLKEIDDLTNLLKSKISVIESEESFYEINENTMLKVLEYSENLLMKWRDYFSLKTCNPYRTKIIIDNVSEETYPVLIKKHEVNYSEILLPTLLHRRRFINRNNIVLESIRRQIARHCTQNIIPLQSDCVVCFTHLYGEERHIDYDNNDVSGVLNILVGNFIQDDAPEYIELYHRAKPVSKADDEGCLIQILPKEKLGLLLDL